MLPPLLGAARARLGASSSRMRQWVESEPCGRSPLPPPPHMNLECSQQQYQAPDSLWRPPQHTPKSAPRTSIGSKMPESFAPVHRNAILPPRARNSLENNAPTRARDPTAKNTRLGAGGWGGGGAMSSRNYSTCKKALSLAKAHTARFQQYHAPHQL